MLTPEYLYRVAERSEEIASELHSYITMQMVDRILLRLSRGDDYIFTSRDAAQIWALQESGIMATDISKEIARITKIQESEILTAMQEAGVKALEYDDSIYRDAGLSPLPLSQSPHLTRIIERNYNDVYQEWRNFTRSTVDGAQTAFISAVDKAYTLSISGVISPTQAVREAINDIANSNIYIEYPSGRRDTIETATARAVRTSISQTTGEIQETRMREMKWDTILTSAHYGARTGDGGENPENHEWWQGKFFSLSGNGEFPDFKTNTGYGTVTGLCGAGCRHSFGPGDGKHNPFADIDVEESRRIEKLNKKQRAMERTIRKTKRAVQTLQKAVEDATDNELKFGLQQDLDRKSYLLTKQNKRYNDFNTENNLKNQNDRLQIAGWDRSNAAKASGAARRYKNLKEN